MTVSKSYKEIVLLDNKTLQVVQVEGKQVTQAALSLGVIRWEN